MHAYEHAHAHARTCIGVENERIETCSEASDDESGEGRDDDIEEDREVEEEGEEEKRRRTQVPSVSEEEIEEEENEEKAEVSMQPTNTSTITTTASSSIASKVKKRKQPSRGVQTISHSARTPLTPSPPEHRATPQHRHSTPWAGKHVSLSPDKETEQVDELEEEEEEIEEEEEWEVKAFAVMPGRGQRRALEALSVQETPSESEEEEEEDTSVPVRGEKRGARAADVTVATKTARGKKGGAKQKVLDAFGSDIDDDGFQEDPQVNALSRRTFRAHLLDYGQLDANILPARAPRHH
jgi:hypothetical protein